MLSNVSTLHPLFLMTILFTIEKTRLAWCGGGSWNAMERSLPIYRSWKDCWGKHPARSVLEVGGSEAAAVIIRCDHLWLVMTPRSHHSLSCQSHSTVVRRPWPASVLLTAGQPQPPVKSARCARPKVGRLTEKPRTPAGGGAVSQAGPCAVPPVQLPPSLHITTLSLSLSLRACLLAQCLQTGQPWLADAHMWRRGGVSPQSWHWQQPAQLHQQQQ